MGDTYFFFSTLRMAKRQMFKSKERPSAFPYFGGARIRYSRRKRESVYRWVRELAVEVSLRAGEPVVTPASWRIAARQWLVTNRLIKIERSEKVSPHFGPKSAHN
jgi:hypothetical protein